jgi:hypothetical protein
LAETFAPTVWPPSKATWIDTVCSGTDDLREDAVERVRVDEGDEVAAEARPRLGIDHLDAGGGELPDRGGDVVHGEAHVVHARPPAGEEAADGRVLGERRHELDASVPEPEVGGLDPLALDPVAELDLGAEERPVRLHGVVEVLDGEGDVVHGAHVHPADPTG